MNDPLDFTSKSNDSSYQTDSNEELESGAQPQPVKFTGRKPRTKVKLTVLISSVVFFLVGALIVGGIIWQSRTLIAENQDVRSDASVS